MQYIIAILIFSFLILIHEFGHFIVARMCGIYVEEFALGMGPKLVSFKGKETIYSIRIFPFGGFCKIYGMEDNPVEGHGDHEVAEEGEEIDDPRCTPERSFNTKSVWKRIAIIIAGPVFNLVSGFICAVIFIALIGYIPAEISVITPDSPAVEIGLKEGDVITKVNGHKINMYEEVQLFLYNNSDPVDLSWTTPSGEKKSTTVTPKFVQYVDEAGNIVGEKYIIGFSPVDRKQGNFVECFDYGLKYVNYVAKSTFFGLKQIFSGNMGRQDVAGAIGIVDVIGDTYEQTRDESAKIRIVNMLNIVIILSASLGIMNLLPIPALDGGRLIFLFIEAITKKKVPEKYENIIHTVGILVLLGLMFLLLINDVLKIFGI